MSSLRPLEFRDAVIDSPGFRNNLQKHILYLKSKSKKVKDVIRATEKLFKAMDQMQQAHRELSSALLNYNGIDDEESSGPGTSQLLEVVNLANFSRDSMSDLNDTDDDKTIKNALNVVSDMINAIEDSRVDILNPIQTVMVNELTDLRKSWLTGPKTDPKAFMRDTASFTQKLDKYMSTKPRECTTQTDEVMRQDRSAFMSRALQYVSDIHEAEELIKSTFLRNVMLLINMSSTFHHQAYDHYQNFRTKISAIHAAVQRSHETFEQISEGTLELREKLLRTPWETIQTVGNESRREGYLFVLTKKAVGTQWIQHFCLYVNRKKMLVLIPYSPCRPVSVPAAEYYTVTSCSCRPSDQSERRFCFDVKVDGRSSVMTMQAQSQADLHEWISVMDDNVPITLASDAVSKTDRIALTPAIFDTLRQLLQEIEKRGIEVSGLYRKPGILSKTKALLQEALKPSGLSEKELEEASIHAVSSAVKLLLRQLEEPLLTYHLHDKFLEVVNSPADVRVEKLKKLLDSLPAINQGLLRILAVHLAKVARCSEKNQMTATNLAIVFAPTVLRSRKETVVAIMNTKHLTLVIQLIIENCSIFFPDGAAETEIGDIVLSVPQDACASAPTLFTANPKSSPLLGQVKGDTCNVTSEQDCLSVDGSDVTSQLTDRGKSHGLIHSETIDSSPHISEEPMPSSEGRVGLLRKPLKSSFPVANLLRVNFHSPARKADGARTVKSASAGAGVANGAIVRTQSHSSPNVYTPDSRVASSTCTHSEAAGESAGKLRPSHLSQRRNQVSKSFRYSSDQPNKAV